MKKKAAIQLNTLITIFLIRVGDVFNKIFFIDIRNAHNINYTNTHLILNSTDRNLDYC